MIMFDRIELATYPDKPLDSMDFNEKEALKSSSVSLQYQAKKLFLELVKKFEKLGRTKSNFSESYKLATYPNALRFSFI